MKKIFFNLLCLVFSFSLTCQNEKDNPTLSGEKDLTFYLLDTEFGLSNDGVWDIEQDYFGFIWIATPEGLNRYDGTQFVTYKKNNSTLSNNFIKQIQVNKDGNLLLATANSLNIYNLKLEKFKNLSVEHKLNKENLSCVYYNEKDKIIIGYEEKGIQIINKDGKLESYTYNKKNRFSLSSNEISCITQEVDSIVWVGTRNDGLNKINLKTKETTRIPLIQNNNDSPSSINSVYSEKNGNIWVGTNNGLYVITKEGDTLNLKKSEIRDKGLSDDNVLCFEEDNLGQMWIGTRNGGLNIINKSDFLSQKIGFKVKWYLPNQDGTSVFNRTVLSIKKDNNNNMWIGTSTGLNFVNPKGEPIKLIHKNNSSKSISHDRISALAKSTNENIWIGTDGSGVDFLNTDTGIFKNYDHSSHNISNNYIISLHEDQKKRLWIGTYQGGLNKMDIETGKCKHYFKDDPERGNDIRAIFEDSKNNIWIATETGGLFIYNEVQDQFNFIHSLDGIYVRDICEDKNGYLWLATEGLGIVKYDLINNVSSLYNSKNIKGFNSDVFYSIISLPNGDILAGTLHEGIIRLNPKNKTIINFNESNGLSNNTVSSIIFENDSSIWLGTFKGISHYNPINNEIYNLETYNNIQKSKFNIGSSIISESGIIYFGGDKGLNVFNPRNIKIKKESHPIVFENLEVLNKKVSITDKKGILDQSILYEDHITLSHNETFLSLDYVTLKYPFVKNTMYSYKVENYHDQWINTNGAGKVNLTNMPPGDYTLKVKAKFGTGDEVSKSLQITINHPFWKTPIAVLCYVILISLSLWGLMKYYSEHLKLKNSFLFEKKQRQLEHDFNEERIMFYTYFSHELKTPLTLIIAPIEDLIKKEENRKQKEKLILIQNNANVLLQSINQLLEFRKYNLGLSKLAIEKHNLSNCLKQWVQNFNPLAKKRKILLSYSGPTEDFFAWFDLEKLHIIVNNLLSNAFKFTKEKGKIHVDLTYDDTNFYIKTQDTGIGITPEDIEHIFNGFYQSNSTKSINGIGIGLTLTKNFIELHNGRIEIKSQLKKGSTFSFYIPRDFSLLKNSKVIDEKQTIINDKLFSDNSTTIKEEEEEEEIFLNLEPNISFDDNKKVVLLIDDNSDILAYLKELLEEEYNLIFASDGEEGLNKALEYIPDIIISDIMMPKINGIELCSTLKKTMETTHIPVILLTAKGNSDTIKKGYEEGAYDYIVKPFSSQLLKVRIKNILGNRKKLRKYFLKETKIPSNLSKNKSKILEQEQEFIHKLESIILGLINNDSIDVNMVAQSIKMNRATLSRKLKAVTGLTINKFIIRVKLNKALELIKEGDLTISQVSYEVGYNDIKHFRQVFKEQFNKVPSQFKSKKHE
ncbi:hybrid sensor histidine kinase/response regulator transcription factor [Flaviramulus basaltis]|nr:hybrid sensor histidine kinase/response regulator transcription factor [Flaviramulus basaltis]